jgi:SDR family mycofactocin-dependent oxidoreductase
MPADAKRQEGRVAFITGGARGQGRSHALRLASEGADIVLCDVLEQLPTVPYPNATADDLAETVRQVEALGQRALGLVADVRDFDQVDRAVVRGLDEFGHVDILVAQAGICTFGRIDAMDPGQWRDMIDTNLTGVFNAIRAALPGMVSRGYGRIIATSSMAGRAGWENIGHYAASKWGVIGLVKSVALEVAAHGVTANVICPSAVNTPMMLNGPSYQLFRPDVVDPSLEDALPAFTGVNVIPVPYVEPSDISDAVAFLASEQAAMVSGAVLSVSAGVNTRNI